MDWKGKINFEVLPQVTGVDVLSKLDDEWSALAEKTSVVGADLVLIEDSEASGAKKKVQRSNLVPQQDTTYATTITAWTPSSPRYYADVVHNLGTKDVLVETYTTDDDETVLVHAIDRTDTNTIRVWVKVQENVRVVVSTGGFSVGSTGVDTNAIHDNIAGEIVAVTEKATPVSADVLLIEDSADSSNKKRVQVGNLPQGGGDNISVNGTAASDANFNNTTPTAPAGEVNVKWQKDTTDPDNISASVQASSETQKGVIEIATQAETDAGTDDTRAVTPLKLAGTLLNSKPATFYADQLDNPVNSDWTVNALAPAVADTNNAGLTVRRFDDTTEEGVGFMLFIPTGVTNLTIRLKSRAETAVTGNVVPQIYNRDIPDNGAVTSWSSATAMTAIAMTSNEYFHYDEETISLSTLGATAGELVQFELTRNGGAGGDTLTGDWSLLEIQVEFS